MGAIGKERAEDQRPFRRVWIKAFWGFDPENEGFLGFTRKGDRTRLFENYGPGDLVLIYGTKGGQTAKSDRGRALGFLEISPEPVDWRTCISEEALRWKREKNVLHKWNYAMPVQRAWRVTPGQAVEIERLAPLTYVRSNVQNIATRGKLLKDSEARRVLELQVVETTVFGLAAVHQTGAELVADGVFRPSRGFASAPGKRGFEVSDGPCKVYLMRWEGDASQLLGSTFGDVRQLGIVKVGMSNDPARRCHGLNSSLPPAGVCRWVVAAESNFYRNVDAAKKVEDRLKGQFERKFTSLGGEYFLGPVTDMGKRFLKII
jgi:hypothetical protein